jgi:hypothetical protein
MRTVTSKRDAILRAGWRAVVLSMIFALALVACSLAYAALFGIAGGDLVVAARNLVIALLSGAAVLWLCVNRELLVEA